MKYALIALALTVSSAAFAGGITGTEGTITGPGYPAQSATGAGTVDATEGGINAPSMQGSCPEGTSPALILNAQANTYSVTCVTTPDYPVGG